MVHAKDIDRIRESGRDFSEAHDDIKKDVQNDIREYTQISCSIRFIKCDSLLPACGDGRPQDSLLGLILTFLWVIFYFTKIKQSTTFSVFLLFINE